jgi:two-component sensor histidine kinase
LKLYRTIKKKNSLISINNTELENAKAQLEKSVEVKETLLREIHRRVKNNLQLVMSLLYIQSKEKDKNMNDFLEISQSRIIAMTLIHGNLYQAEDLSKVNFKEYASSLTQAIIASYNNLQKDIALIIEIDSIYLDIQTSIPLGLIINELISNAYKHAFVNDNKGIITLQLVQNENDFELVVKDNGVGMAEKKSTKKSLGLELVQQLVSQIQGSLRVQDISGLLYLIQFQNKSIIIYET